MEFEELKKKVHEFNHLIENMDEERLRQLTEVSKDKVVKEALDLSEEEYIKGMRAVLEYVKDEVGEGNLVEDIKGFIQRFEISVKKKGGRNSSHD